MHTFCRRRKLTAEPWGRSPGSEEANGLAVNPCLVPFAKVSTFLVILAGEDFTLSGSRTNTLDAIAQKFAKLVATWIHEGRVVTSKGHIASDRFVKCLGKVPLIISCKS